MRLRLPIITLALLLVSHLGEAQDQDPLPPLSAGPLEPGPDMPPGGSVEVGYRGTDATGDVARLERYRDLRSGVFSRIRFAQQADAYRLDVSAYDIGYRDQRYRGLYDRGTLRVTGAFDSIPINYGYNTSTPWVEQSPGVLTLDLATRQRVQSKQVIGIPQNVADLQKGSIYPSIATPYTLQALRQTGGVSFGYDATEHLSFDGAFSSASRTGHQPWGASFSFNVANEVPLALDNRTNTATAGLDWTHDHGLFRVGWYGSFFDNNVHELYWDNAYRATDASPYDPSGYSNGNGAAHGRLATAPSNSLNTVNLTGVYRFPRHSTLNGSVAFTRMNQDDALIPWTSNPVILGNPATLAQFPNLASLPRPTAQASVDGTNAVLNFVTRPERKLTLTVHYRYNDHVNNTPLFNGTQYVRFDAVPEATGGFTEQFNIKENQVNVDATVDLWRYTAFRIGYGYDSFDRTGRAFNNTAENTVRASLDSVGSQWITVRAIYEFARRKGSGFSQDALEEGGSQPGLRFYDEADRDRHRGTLLVTVNPLENVDVTASVASGKDTYNGPGHEFGLLDADVTSVNVGVNYSLTSAVSVGVNYGHDHYNSNQKSRNANPPPDPTFTDPKRDWTLNNAENINTVTFYAEAPKLGKASARLSYDYSDSDNGFLFGGPRVASLASIGQFIPLPNVTNAWHRLEADFRYMFVRKVGVGVSYWFEKLAVSDFDTIDLPGQPGTPRIDYLGELSTGYGNRPYRGNTVFARLIYLF